MAVAQIEKLITGLQETDPNEFDPVKRILEGFQHFKINKFEYDTTCYATRKVLSKYKHMIPLSFIWILLHLKHSHQRWYKCYNAILATKTSKDKLQAYDTSLYFFYFFLYFNFFSSLLWWWWALWPIVGVVVMGFVAGCGCCCDGFYG